MTPNDFDQAMREWRAGRRREWRERLRTAAMWAAAVAAFSGPFVTYLLMR